MSAKSTVTISRNTALGRIVHINNLAVNEDYREIEKVTAEGMSISRFVDSYVSHKMGSLQRWTNSMLADKMDEPFFRFSVYENYTVVDEEE